MDSQLYKKYQENFMKNNNGTTIHETFVTILPSYLTTLLTINLFTVIPQVVHIPLKFVIEYFLIIFPIILNVTVLNNRIWEITVALTIICLTSVAKQLHRKTHVSLFIQLPVRRPEYISAARAIINLITAVCILAVDFKSFPRTLAKTETFGFGLMDTGVGLFVFSNGIIAPHINHNSDDKESPSMLDVRNKFKKMLINSIPLFILGFSRFIITNEIDYQQHVSEYGVHWNFFITLGITKIIGTLIVSILSTLQLDILKYVSVIVIILHEMLLQLGLANYILNENLKRDTYFRANREGIVSLPGYIALYLASLYIGYLLKSNTEVVRVREFLKKIGKISFISIVLWKIVYICEEMFGVSRRLANMGYVIWILSLGTTMIILFMFLELFYYFITFEKSKYMDYNTNSDDETNNSKINRNRRNIRIRLGNRYRSRPTIMTSRTNNKGYLPIILKAINYNGLTFFLIANLLTGLINIIFQTLLFDCVGSIFILSIYMFILCYVITFLYINEIKLKIW